jgi:hypothetical protein
MSANRTLDERAKKPDLDEPTRRIAERLLNTPPKPHKEMKLGKSRTKANPKTNPTGMTVPKKRSK